jgi:SAM-dependent MidA family methyltransferase
MTKSDDSRAGSLSERLRERIKLAGPMTFHDWMQAALYDEQDGYYLRPGRVRQGRAGDYRTAPETSPLFGATFGNYFMKSYFDLGAPEKWTIVEVGAGRGDFAHSVLSSLQRDFPNIFAATHYIIDEINNDERNATAEKLSDFKDRVEFRSLAEINEPLDFAIIFSNELLDAFPVHRVAGRNGALRELFVDLNDAGDFVWTDNELTPRVSEYCQRIQLQIDDGQVYEVNLAAEDFLARAASLIDRGLLISVDYGADRADLLNDPNRSSGTLRAFHRHQMIDDVLSHPGELDLTTTVDWTQIQDAGARFGLETLRLHSLDRFLLSEGLPEQILSVSADMKDTAEILNLHAGARELIMPNGLAAHFQVLVQRKSQGLV